MRWLTDNGTVLCLHVLGRVNIVAGQNLVRVQGNRVLVDNDPECRPIAGCPNYGIGIKPCLRSLRVQTGYSDFLRINGRRICLDTVTGLTDGTPPGTVMYRVAVPGHSIVSEG
jgi:hypothetical protein